ncbi:MAG: 50S ribosomal protein L18 [Planctomycetes bacterium]|nr:50S ribosomal protein L18 [Planctomycetota bacterium]
MDKHAQKTIRRTRRRYGIRKRLFGTTERPRLCVFRSNQHIYAQIIDDVQGKTLAAASSKALEKGSNTAAATEVGKALAERAKEAGVQTVAFDRGGYRFHGRVKALAEAAREGGLKF